MVSSSAWRLSAIWELLATCDAKNESLLAREMIHRPYDEELDKWTGK